MSEDTVEVEAVEQDNTQSFTFDDMENMHDVAEAEEAAEAEEVEAAEEAREESEISDEAMELGAMLNLNVGGESGLEVPEGALVTVKVDGEDVQVPFKDLMVNYSGKVPFDKKFSELDVERKGFTKDKEDLQAGLQNVLSLINSDNPLDALEYLVEISEQDPLVVRKNLLAFMDKRYEETAHLSEDERESLNLASEVKYYKNKESKAEEAKNYDQGQKMFQNMVFKSCDDLGIETAEWSELYKELQADEELNLSGMSDDEVGETVSQWKQAQELDGAMYELLGEVNPDTEPDEEHIAMMKKVSREHPEATAQDLKDIALEVFGTKKSKTLSRKINKTKPKNTPRVEGTINANSDAFTWDDL